MTPAQLQNLGNELRALVFARTKILSLDLVCPRETSEMTPCVARDGGTCVIESNEAAICVGCGTSIEQQIALEKEKVK